MVINYHELVREGGRDDTPCGRTSKYQSLVVTHRAPPVLGTESKPTGLQTRSEEKTEWDELRKWAGTGSCWATGRDENSAQMSRIVLPKEKAALAFPEQKLGLGIQDDIIRSEAGVVATRESPLKGWGKRSELLRSICVRHSAGHITYGSPAWASNGGRWWSAWTLISTPHGFCQRIYSFPRWEGKPLEMKNLMPCAQ